MCKVVILVTSSVTPRARVGVDDSDLRMHEYRAGLEFWSRQGRDYPVVYCDSSGAESWRIERVLAGLPIAETLLYSGSLAPRGKGHAELDIIRHALATSTIIGPDSLIVKVSGRYRAQTWEKALLMRAQPPVVTDLSRRLTWAESKVFLMRADLIQRYLLPQAEWLDDETERYLEHALARATLRAVADGHPWSVPVVPLRLQGRRDFDSREMQYRWSSYSFRLARHAIRRRVLMSDWSAN